MITIYTVTYNEEVLIQFMVDHYRERFPNCRIVVYDNLSTDNTVRIALANGCEVVSYDTNNYLKDSQYLEIKNNCWKDAKTNWVLICDLDELLDINNKELKKEENFGTSMIRAEGYDMVDIDDKLDISGIRFGARSVANDKSFLFNKRDIREINYEIGCHRCNPVGNIIYSKRVYKLYHYCYINYDVTVKKYKTYRARISPEDIKNNCSFYSESPEEIRELYMETRKNAVRLR